MLVPNDNIMKNGRIIKASVKSMDFAAKSLTLSSGAHISYDYCIIASGAKSKAPVEPPTGSAPHEYFNNVASQIAHAHNIVLLGGGPVSIELAGEIKAKHPNTKVAVVSAAPSLCNNMKFPAETSAKIADTLKSVGVDTVLNHPIDLGVHANESLIHHSPAKNYSSELAHVDLVINCTGMVPNTKFVPSAYVNEMGFIKVDAHFQVAENVFAIGDCADVKEAKNFVNVAGKAYMQGFPVGHSDVVSDNIKALAFGGQMSAYTPNSYVAGIIPCGPNASVTLGFPDEFGKYKSHSYFYEPQFQFAKADKVPQMPSL